MFRDVSLLIFSGVYVNFPLGKVEGYPLNEQTDLFLEWFKNVITSLALNFEF